MKTFPVLQGEDLLGRSRELPAAFDGKLNLVLVAFYREQQQDIDCYMPLAEEVMQEYEGFAFFEVPIISPLFKFMKPVIDAGMRSYVNSEAGRSRVITVFTSQNKVAKMLSLTDKDNVAALLVDNNGEILYCIEGPCTPNVEVELRKAITTHGVSLLVERLPNMAN